MPRDQLPPLNLLRAFEAVARHLSIKHAAEELYLTRSAVSRQIMKLERHVHRPLFSRGHKRLALTQLGERLRGVVTRYLGELEQVLRVPGRPQGPPRLVISVDPDFAGLWLVPRLDDFCAIAPDMLIEIRAETSTLASMDPQVGCAIQYAKVSEDPKVGDMLFRSRLFPVCSKNLPQWSKLRGVNDLRGQILLHDRSTAEWEEYLRICGADFEMNTKGHAVFTATANCLDAAARGSGVAMGDDCLASNLLRSGTLMRLLDESILSRNAYYFIPAEEPLDHPSVEKFRRWLMKAIALERKRLRDGK